MSISLTYFTPSSRRAGNVFQYMVTGTTIGDRVTGSSCFSGELKGDGITRGEPVMLEGVRNRADGRDILGGVELRLFSISRSIFLSEASKSASVKSSEMELV